MRSLIQPNDLGAHQTTAGGPHFPLPNPGSDAVCGESLDQQLALAVALHKGGDFERAETIYRDILAADPHHSDALHLLGVIALHRRDYGCAATLIERAIVADPSRALYHCNAGAAHRSLGRLDLAIEAFRRAIHFDPTLAGAHYNLALALEGADRLDLAIIELQQTVSIAPNFSDAWNAFGRILASQDRGADAGVCYRRAIELRPSFVEAHFNLGNLLSRQGEHAAAVEEYRLSLVLASQNGVTIPAAFDSKVLAQIHNNLGNSFKSLGRHSEALRAFHRAIEFEPEFAEAHNNLGAVLQYQGALDEAEDAYRRALACNPQLDRVYTNLGNLHCDRGRLEDALACYDQAVRLCPSSAKARFNRALTLLRSGDLHRGWAEYESRFERKVERRNFHEPEWDGSPLGGRRLFVYAEQGIGDEILFASCLPDLARCGGHVVVECEARLVPLFARSFPWSTVIQRPVRLTSIGAIDPPVDVQIAMGSLPRLLRNERTAFPAHRGYLESNATRASEWRHRLKGTGQVAVGFSWRGGKDPDIQRRRSTSPADWIPLLSIPRVTFVDLQYGVCPADRDALLCHKDVVGFKEVDPLRDLDEFAALMSACDLVISVDNSTVHLAGAMGLCVWTLLPFASDWRWMMSARETPWYPSMQLYRQQSAGDWNPVFCQLAADLQTKVAACEPVDVLLASRSCQSAALAAPINP
jgi:tetratricopeptide (TPR) repeat protein